MGTDHDSAVRLARDGRNDGVLLPCVREALGENSILSTSVLDDLVDLLKNPIGGLKAVIGLEVSSVETGQLLEVGLHVLLLEVLGELLDIVLVDAFLGERDCALGVDALGAERRCVGDIHKVLAVL